MNKIIDRALDLSKLGIDYIMGADSIENKHMDCSAFLWRCFNSKKFDGHYWRNTNWLWNDIDKDHTKFDRIDSVKDIQAGDIIVYKGSNGKAGHCAILFAVDIKENITIIDCSFSQKGITKRLGNFFKKKDFRIGRYK